jgi:Fe-S-cluster containining protein
MAHADSSEHEDLPAGEFSAWLHGMQRALRGERGSVVPCGGCTACCTSSQFVHIGPDETETLARVPSELLFPAPRMPVGHVLLGYDDHGRCPMLTDDRCSIYEHRPRACRTYDCRVFPATGLEIGDDDKALIAQRARRWRFDFPTEVDQNERDAVRSAARFVQEHEDLLPEGSAPTNATQVAVLAVEAHEAFLRHDTDTGRATAVNPGVDDVRVVLTHRTRARPGTWAPTGARR